MRPEAQQAYGLIVHLVMGGWYPICFALFIFLKPERAVATGLVTGFLLLPKASYDFPGFPNYDKALSIVLGVFVAALLFDSGRLLTWRPRSVDLPMGILCLAPFLSAVINGDGAYEGISNSFDFSMRWGLPWILGRIYFHDFEAQKFLAATVVAGALIYLPFALYEVKMSPQLHKLVYGVPLKSFKHAMRSGGLWRPNVFISHGLAYGLYNGIAAMLAFWLWWFLLRTIVRRRRNDGQATFLCRVVHGSAACPAQCAALDRCFAEGGFDGLGERDLHRRRHCVRIYPDEGVRARSDPGQCPRQRCRMHLGSPDRSPGRS